MALYKLCPHCGRRVLIGEKCDCKAVQEIEAAKQKRYDQVKRDRQAKKFYSSVRWQAMRNEVMAAAYGLDEVDWNIGQATKGNVIHHIVPLRENPDRALDPYNLICLSAETHSYIHKLYNSNQKAEIQKQLFLLTEKRIKRHLR